MQNKVALAWGNIALIDYRRQLLAGTYNLYCWLVEDSLDDDLNFLGTVQPNPNTSDSPHLCLEFVDIKVPVHYPSTEEVSLFLFVVLPVDTISSTCLVEEASLGCITEGSHYPAYVCLTMSTGTICLVILNCGGIRNKCCSEVKLPLSPPDEVMMDTLEACTYEDCYLQCCVDTASCNVRSLSVSLGSFVSEPHPQHFQCPSHSVIL